MRVVSCIVFLDWQNGGHLSCQMRALLRIFRPFCPTVASASMSAKLPPSSAFLQHHLEAALQGDSKAVERLLNAQRSYLLLLAEAELESDLRVKASASDLVQETIVKAHQSIGDFRGDNAQQWRHWLKAILRNNARDLRRRYVESAKRSIRKEIQDVDDAGQDVPQPDSESPSALVSTQEQVELLEELLPLLSERYQIVLRLRFWEQQSYEQIAEACQSTPEAIRKVLFRAVEALDRAFRQRGL